ncbi:MAG: bifunctional 4-hydroxy-2-oxoglutarate aldolase/2-dehydro-3-deoxy-phosphogluconate aldolase [Cellulomonadaceae bacterium]|jgi:2-dehydro-3-deoxyphosphogluconate aldolase/(4S)-4-hydroxy-2-oxoglutarate aldolase|nr:bifunctional 4-hydroxy-2-oxoglutarate aldolase/2-dehydro-3-deoxy-phosphogluconate aldolase [Cellulomonadaceae bacterium]
MTTDATIIDAIATARIVPVVVVDGPAEGLALADAISAGGLPIAEVTLRLPRALDALKAIAAERPDVIVGAGTVITAAQVDEVVDAGAQFIVSPGTFEPVIRRAQERGVPILPGVASASDVMRALDLDVTLVKLFPAGVVGGPGAIKALAGPFPQVKFMPTGGVSADNLHTYLDLPSVVAAGGSWMVDRTLVTAGYWDEITRRTREAVTLAQR